MKKMLCLLLFFSFGTFCFAQAEEPLPEKLWKEIIELKLSNKRSGLRTWNGDVKVALDGDYTNKDSIEPILLAASSNIAPNGDSPFSFPLGGVGSKIHFIKLSPVSKFIIFFLYLFFYFFNIKSV